MNNVIQLKLSPFSLTAGTSVAATLRWMRRGMTLALILGNLALVMWGR